MEDPTPTQSAQPSATNSNILPISRAATARAMSDPSAIAGTHPVSVLLGFLPELQARALVLTDNFVDGPHDFGEITRFWADAIRGRNRLRQVPAPTTNVEALLPPEFVRLEEELFQSQTFHQFYQGGAQFRLRRVHVKRLITPQYYLNRDCVDAMVTVAPEPDDWAGAFEFAFGLGAAIPDPILDGGAIVFRTATTRLCQLPTPEWRRVGPHEVEVVQRIETRPNFFQVARFSAPGIDDRLVITNGIHRAAALILKGWDYVPVLLRNAHSLMEVGFVPGAPGMGGVIPEQELLQNRRPPYVSDFFNAEATVELRQRNMEQGARVASQVEFFSLPGQ